MIALSFKRFDAAPDDPYPMTYLRGARTVEPAVGRPAATIRFEVTPKWGLGG